jgi:hypothetical protein
MVIRSSETSVDFYRTAWSYNSEHDILHSQSCENLKSNAQKFYLSTVMIFVNIEVEIFPLSSQFPSSFIPHFPPLLPHTHNYRAVSHIAIYL